MVYIYKFISHTNADKYNKYVLCYFSVNMSGGEFYGPALPPGFTKGSSDTQSQEAVPVLSNSRKRHHRSSSSDFSSSSASSRSSEQRNDDGCKSSKKEPSQLSEQMFGPALPAGFTSGGQPVSLESSFIGPVLPLSAVSSAITQVSDGDDDIGPSPDLNTDSKMQSTIEQIESRAKLMKDKLEGKVFCYFHASCYV